MIVSIHPAAADELRETASFYSKQANQALGFAFIAEFERALCLLSSNPELGAIWRGIVGAYHCADFHTTLCIKSSRKNSRLLLWRTSAGDQATGKTEADHF